MMPLPPNLNSVPLSITLDMVTTALLDIMILLLSVSLLIVKLPVPGPRIRRFLVICRSPLVSLIVLPLSLSSNVMVLPEVHCQSPSAVTQFHYPADW